MAYAGLIYSYGDSTAVVSSLNAIAMIFGLGGGSGPHLFSGSLIILAGFIALMFTILTSTVGRKPNYMAFWSFFLLYTVGIQTPMDLTVTDYYNSSPPAVVSNIPTIVGFPASLVSQISVRLADVIATVMENPTNTESFQTGGFVDPLKIIMSLRPDNMTKVNPYFNRSMQNFVADCAVWSVDGSGNSLWDEKMAITAPTLNTYLLNSTALPTTGLTTYFSATNPTGTTMTCDDAQIALNNITLSVGAGQVMDETDLAKLIQKSDSDRPIAITTGTALPTTTEALNNVTLGLTGGSISAQNFMINMIAMQPIADGIYCKDLSSSAFQTCLANAQIITAMEKTRISSAAGASIFAKTAVPMMNILMVLFFLFSPILLIVALMMPHKTLQILGGYIMFAIWTQSWLPAAMVINYIIQMQATTALSQMAATGINGMNVYQYYEILATKIGLASELFAMTPMLTMALLSGSVYGLTQVSGAMNSKTHFDDAALAPGTMHTADVTSIGSKVQVGPNAKMGIMADGNLGNDGTFGQAGPMTISQKESMEAATKAQGQVAYSKGQKAQQALTTTMMSQTSESEKSDYYQSFGEANSRSKSDEATHVHELGMQIGKTLGLGEKEQQKLDGYIGLQLSAGTPLSELLGSGASIIGKAGISRDLSKEQTESINKTMSSSDKDSSNIKEALSKDFKSEKRVSYLSSVGSLMSTTKADAFTSAATEAADATEKHERMSTDSSNIGVGLSTTSDQVAGVMSGSGFGDGNGVKQHLKADYLKMGGSEEKWNAAMAQAQKRRGITHNSVPDQGGMAVEAFIGESRNLGEAGAQAGSSLVASTLGGAFKGSGYIHPQMSGEDNARLAAVHDMASGGTGTVTEMANQQTRGNENIPGSNAKVDKNIGKTTETGRAVTGELSKPAPTPDFNAIVQKNKEEMGLTKEAWGAAYSADTNSRVANGAFKGLVGLGAIGMTAAMAPELAGTAMGGAATAGLAASAVKFGMDGVDKLVPQQNMFNLANSSEKPQPVAGGTTTNIINNNQPSTGKSGGKGATNIKVDPKIDVNSKIDASEIAHGTAQADKMKRENPRDAASPTIISPTPGPGMPTPIAMQPMQTEKPKPPA